MGVQVPGLCSDPVSYWVFGEMLESAITDVPTQMARDGVASQ